MPDLSTLTNKELIGIYNGLGDPPLKSWKGKKSVLIDRIMTLQSTAQIASAAAKTKPLRSGAQVAEVSSVLSKASAARKAAERKPAGETKQKATGKQGTRTIRATAIDLLCRVEYHEDRNLKPGPNNVVPPGHKGARSVGVPYDRVIAAIKAEFPDCQTTVACLRWYSVKIRVEELGYEGLKLPQRRPRAKPVRTDR